MSSIFISHSSRDKGVASEVKQRLQNQGHRSVFLDFDPADGIPAGRNWERELYTKLRQCRAVIILCSQHSMSSSWCFAEITHAKALGKQIFPLKLDSCNLMGLLTDVQIIDLTSGQEEAYQRLWQGLLAAGLDPRNLFDWDRSRPPYPGLMTFEEQDAAIFCGRDSDIRDGLGLVNRLRFFGGKRLCLVLGASGSGKSSLVRAGIVPRLKRDQQSWIVVNPFRPLENPLAELSKVLARCFERYSVQRDWQEIREQLELCPNTIKPDVSNWLNLAKQLHSAARQSEATILLVIDQMEELLSLTPEEPANRFLLLLQAVLEYDSSPFMVLGTLRSDFLGAFQKHLALGAMSFDSLPVGRMQAEQLAQVITGPAAVAGLELGEGLVPAMVNDTKTDDALPLLAFSLRELWKSCGEDGCLEKKEYEELGKLEGSIGRVAETVLDAEVSSQSPRRKEVEQQLGTAFLKLVWINQEGKYARRKANWTDMPASVRSLLERLVKARLLVSSGDEQGRFLEVSHEALFRSWPRLADLLQTDREFLLWRNRLSEARLSWEQSSGAEGALLREPLLAQAKEWYQKRNKDLSQPEQEFIQRSIALDDHLRQQEKERTQRELETTRKIAQESEGRRKAEEVARLEAEQRAKEAEARQQAQQEAREQAEEARKQAVQRAEQETKARKAAQTTNRVTVGAFVFVLAFALFSGFQWRNSEINQIRALRESSEDLFVSNRKLDALISSLRAGKKLNQPLLQIFPPPTEIKDEFKVTLQKVVYQMHERNRLNAGQNVSGIRVSFIPDNPEQLVTVGEDGTIKLWNFQGQQLWNRRDKLTINNNISISRDKILATAAGGDGTISLRNLKGQQLSTWKGNQGWIRSISFSPNGQLLATGGEKGARLWNLQGHELAKLESEPEWVWSVSFSPNGQLLATGGSDGTRLWNLQNRQVAKLEGDQERVRSVSFSPNGQYLATVGDDGRFCLWNLQNRQLIGCRQGDSSGLWFVSFSPNGQLLATGGASGITRFWNLKGQQVAELKGNQTAVASISFSLDGKRLAIAGDGNTVDLWDFQGQQVATMVDRQDLITDISFSPDGQQLATGGEKGTVRLWDLQANELYKFSNHQGLIESISFSPDGQQLTTAGDDSTVRSWNLHGQKLAEEKFPVDVKNYFNCSLSSREKCFWFSPDSRLLAGITAQGTVHVRNLQGEELISTPIDTNVNNEFQSLWFSPDSRLLAGLQGNGLISVWDLQDKSLKTQFSAHPGGIYSVMFYSNNQRLAIAGGDGTVRLRDLQGNELLKFTAYQPGAGVQSLSLSPNGQQLATVGGEDGTVRLWNFQGQQLAEFPANARRVVFSPDSKRIATIAYYGTAKLWQIETFEELMKRSCNWARDYLENNQSVENSNKHLCNGVK